MRGVSDGGEPVDGGTFTYAAYAEPASLDPAVTIAAVTTGGAEMINLYDTLMNFDADAQEFEPRLAEGLEPDKDHDTWTLTLREGVTFSDGTPLAAAAVKWSQDRYASMPAPEAALWNGNVTEVVVEDERTVVYELNKPWPGFPSILSTGPGMIVAKSAVDKDGKFTPVGAGAFTLERWAQSEELALTAREDYWDGAPHLDKVRFVYLNDQRAGLESLRSDGVDAVLVRDPDIVDEVLEEEWPGYVNMVAASNTALINASEGRPGADVRIRQAMALAIGPDLIAERAYGGSGLSDSTLFQDYSAWHTETAGLELDQDRARVLVEEAKADGWDGTIEYLDATDPASRATMQAVKGSLEAVGFTVTTRPMRTIAEQISTIVVDRDYDVAAWGLNYREADPFSKMFATMHSDGTQVYDMYTSKEMDAALEELQAAAEPAERVAAMDRIQQLVNTDVPYLNWGPFSEYNAWDEDVHGVVGGAASMIHLADAWVG
ncbi:ABC transporter substrate-binding protein [Nocardioides sp. zg-DK7169]|nr:ABC transporter substrate-binding protein [Nocardioides sp. zg-DK7169]